MNVRLIVTYDPAHLKSCQDSLNKVMDSVCTKSKLLKSKYSGIFLIDIPKAKKVVKKLITLSKKNPEIFGKTHRYIPVDKWVSSKIPDMQKAVKAFVPKIGENEKWKMDLEKRHYHKLEYDELIVKLTDVVDRRKIDLDKPKKIIKVEIIGTNAGVSLLEPGEFLAVP